MDDTLAQTTFRSLHRQIERLYSRASRAHDQRVAAEARAKDARLRAKTAESSIHAMTLLLADAQQARSQVADASDYLEEITGQAIVWSPVTVLIGMHRQQRESLEKVNPGEAEAIALSRDDWKARAEALQAQLQAYERVQE